MTELEKEHKHENQVCSKGRWWGVRLIFFSHMELFLKKNTVLVWINRNTASDGGESQIISFVNYMNV